MRSGSGAGDEARTRYLHLGKVALYRMSYTRRNVHYYSRNREFVKTQNAKNTEINFVKEISAKAHGDGYMSFSSNFWLDFVTVWGVIRLNLEPTQKADCISRIFIPKIDSPAQKMKDFSTLPMYLGCLKIVLRHPGSPFALTPPAGRPPGRELFPPAC